jgi:hypothetical protein
MVTRQSNREFWLAFFAILVVTALYFLIITVAGKIPAASGFFGHMLGVIGFLLMLMTEILYSLRKRSRSARWGRMSSWLSFHIFTGIVGPYLVLLHTAWTFKGLAGIVTLMTLIVVVSGFIGRYIYTSIPRSADGIEVEASKIEQEISQIANEIKTLDQKQAAHLRALLKRQDQLERQIGSMNRARKLLSLWHTIHIPLGMALFSATCIHIGAALYYATFLH